MEIGTEEEQPVQYPIPVDPARRVRRETVPETSPAEAPAAVPEPAHARELVRVGRVGPCGCECCYGGFCGGCGHAGCGGR